MNTQERNITFTHKLYPTEDLCNLLPNEFKFIPRMEDLVFYNVGDYKSSQKIHDNRHVKMQDFIHEYKISKQLGY